ncbi:MAG: vitamin B12 transporter [Halioglobus sp.]|jgi:vitamin B12 transporter
MRKTQFAPMISLLSLMLGPGAALADSEPVESVLVTGTYSPTEKLTSSVTVLDEQAIQVLNKRSVAGLLKTIPGVLVEEQGGPGGLTAVSIRGGESNFTLVLLDGVAINDPTNFRGGGFDFSNLNSSLVERIEVVKGAQSSVYGSDALAGVINIITRAPEQGHHQEVYAQWGEDDFTDLGVNAQGRVDNFEYTLELARRDEGEPVPGSQRENDSANLRLGWRPSNGQSLFVSYRYLDGDRSSYPEQSGGPLFAEIDELDTAQYEQQILAVDWTVELSSHWISTLRGNRFDYEEVYSSPGIEPYTEVPPNASDTHFTRDQLQWVNTLTLNEQYTFNIGADYRDEEGSSTGYLEFFGQLLPTDFSLNRSSVGLFADVSASPVDAVLLRGSVRYDDPEDFDSETSVQLGAKYSLTEAVILAANWGEAYKLPSFFALGHGLVGNPDLKPEQAESWDLGIAWEASEALRLEGTWFNNDYRDLVDFDDATFRNVNRKQVETSGVELAASWQVHSTLQLQAQGTYTDIEVIDEPSVLTGRPEWAAGIIAQWQIAPHWSSVLDYRYTGEQYAASRHTGEEVTTQLDDFHRVDWVLEWQPDTAWQILLSVDNLLDENYQTSVGFPAAERAARVGVRYSH